MFVACQQCHHFSLARRPAAAARTTRDGALLKQTMSVANLVSFPFLFCLSELGMGDGGDAAKPLVQDGRTPFGLHISRWQIRHSPCFLLTWQKTLRREPSHKQTRSPQRQTSRNIDVPASPLPSKEQQLLVQQVAFVFLQLKKQRLDANLTCKTRASSAFHSSLQRRASLRCWHSKYCSRSSRAIISERH